MHVARWVLATLVTVSIVLAAVSVRVHRSEGGGFPPPSSGHLLPFDSTLAGPPRVLGMLGDAELDEVVDVATAGDSLFMLSRSSWRMISGARVRGPYGAQPSGAPEGIGRAARITAVGSSVYILDVGRREVSRWSRDGRLLERLPIGSPARSILPQDLAVAGSGRIYVVAQEVQRTSTRWLVLQLATGRAPLVLRRAPDDASLFTQPRIAVAGSELLLFDPVDHARFELFAEQSHARVDGPVWQTPDSLRARYAERMSRIGAELGAPMALPDRLPSLQKATITRTGVILTGTNPIGDALHVEAFARDGTPLGRLTDEPVSAPVFLTPDGVVRISEEPRSIVFTLLPIGRN